MRRRSHLNVWIAFADFFCVIGLLMLALYGGAQNRVGPVIAIDKKARVVASTIYRGLFVRGWHQVEYDPKLVAIEIPEAVLFEFKSYEVNDPQMIRDLAEVLNETDRSLSLSEFSFTIIGHTDDYSPSGEDGRYDSYNMWLSRQRANAVERLLERTGVDPRRIQVSTRGMGPYDPKVDNCYGPNPAGKPRHHCLASGLPLRPKDELRPNRRIELKIGIYSAASAGRKPSM